MSHRQLLLLETLGVKMSLLESVPAHLQLPVAVTCYWTRCSEPKVNLHHLKALLLMIVAGELHRITNESGMSPEDTISDAEITVSVSTWYSQKYSQVSTFSNVSTC